MSSSTSPPGRATRSPPPGRARARPRSSRAPPAAGTPPITPTTSGRPTGQAPGRRASAPGARRAASGDAGASGPVVAVAANGADLGPAEVAAGAAIAAAQRARVLLFGPAEELGEPVPGVEI